MDCLWTFVFVTFQYLSCASRSGGAGRLYSDRQRQSGVSVVPAVMSDECAAVVFLSFSVLYKHRHRARYLLRSLEFCGSLWRLCLLPVRLLSLCFLETLQVEARRP